MDVYPVEIRGKKNENKISEEYYAFNLIGLVDGVDFEKSKLIKIRCQKYRYTIDSLRINPKTVQRFPYVSTQSKFELYYCR